MKKYVFLLIILFRICSSLSSQIRFETHIINDNIYDGFHKMDISDLDNDGDVDIVCSALVDGLLIWFENLGGHSFAEHLIDSDVFGANDVHFVDVDHDLELDILLAAENQIIWYQNAGNLSFNKTIISNSAHGAECLNPIDFDKDNDIDIVSANSNSNELAWYKNNGDQVFVEHVISDTMTNVSGVASVDLDGDSDIDLIASGDGHLVWFERLDDDTFFSHKISDEGGVGNNSILDFDFDGDLDIWADLLYLENLGEQQFKSHTISNEPASGVFPCDMEGDGDLDVIYFYQVFPEGSVSWIEFEDMNPLKTHLIDNSPTLDVCPVDVDGDDYKDIYTTGSGGLRFYASNPSRDSYVEIPDTNFLNALIDEGVDSNGDNLISYEEAESITSLTVARGIDPGSGEPCYYFGCVMGGISSIKSLTGIEAFKNLDTLHCSCASLEILDISGNQELRYLDCSNNQLTSLDVSNNPALTELFCCCNQLTNLDVSNNTALTGLYFNSNQLTNLDVSNNTALTGLYCGGNELTCLDVSKNTALTFLACWGNQLTSLDVSTNIALKDLNLVNMPTLHEVCVWEGFHANIVQTDNSPNVYFTTDCVYNNDSIVFIPDTAFLHALIEEGVDTNEDSLISDAEAESITTLNVSTVLEMNGNIRDMTGIEAFVNLVSLSCGGHLLQELDLNHNKALKYLDVLGLRHVEDVGWGPDGRLSSLELSACTALEYLHCSGNQLKRIALSNQAELKYFDCDGNEFENLDLSHNPKLEFLSCIHCDLPCLDISKNTELKSLYINDNPLLKEVCVWETFNMDSIDIATEGCPAICFETDCNGVCGPMDIEEFRKADLSIYPNPTNTLLNIETDNSNLVEIQVNSLNGQRLLHEEVAGTTHQLDISSFQKGIYFITIWSMDFVTTRKIIKL